MYNHIH